MAAFVCPLASKPVRSNYVPSPTQMLSLFLYPGHFPRVQLTMSRQAGWGVLQKAVWRRGMWHGQVVEWLHHKQKETQ